jgi:hypothetical protein
MWNWERRSKEKERKRIIVNGSGYDRCHCLLTGRLEEYLSKSDIKSDDLVMRPSTDRGQSPNELSLVRHVMRRAPQ